MRHEVKESKGSRCEYEFSSRIMYASLRTSSLNWWVAEQNKWPLVLIHPITTRLRPGAWSTPSLTGRGAHKGKKTSRHTPGSRAIIEAVCSSSRLTYIFLKGISVPSNNLRLGFFFSFLRFLDQRKIADDYRIPPPNQKPTQG